MTAKGQLDVAGRLNAKNGLAISGNDTFIIKNISQISNYHFEYS